MKPGELVSSLVTNELYDEAIAVVHLIRKVSSLESREEKKKEVKEKTVVVSITKVINEVKVKLALFDLLRRKSKRDDHTPEKILEYVKYFKPFKLEKNLLSELERVSKDVFEYKVE